MEQVDGGGYGEPNRDGPGSSKMCRYGKVPLFMAIPHVIHWDTAPLRDAPLEGKRCVWKESALMAVPTRVTVTMNPSATPTCPCVNRSTWGSMLNT
jgi:hypothetical protein